MAETDRRILEKEMELQINPKSTILYAGNGIDFCGYIHHRNIKGSQSIRAEVKEERKTIRSRGIGTCRV